MLTQIDRWKCDNPDCGEEVETRLGVTPDSGFRGNANDNSDNSVGGDWFAHTADCIEPAVKATLELDL